MSRRALVASGVAVAALGALAAGWLLTTGRGGDVPSAALEMTGEVGDRGAGWDDPVHDPTLVKVGDTYYVFSTGVLNPSDPGGIFLRRSTGTPAGPWESIGAIPLPEWTRDYDVQHLWAPDAVLIDGLVHVYYSASSFGSNRSAIGLTTSATPEDLTSWKDLGPVLTSRPSDDHNAIDPDLVHVDDRWWMAFGSHWDGIKLQRMAGPTEPTGEILSLARRPGVAHNAIEAPTIFFRDGWFYLLTSWDACCRGTDSTYRIAVGRAEEITGPYVDADGVRLDEGGGTVILASEGAQVGPGGQDVMEEDGHHYLVHHYYDGDAGGTIRMQVRELGWRDGWPHVEG